MEIPDRVGQLLGEDEGITGALCDLRERNQRGEIEHLAIVWSDKEKDCYISVMSQSAMTVVGLLQWAILDLLEQKKQDGKLGESQRGE